jgi:hypothetical protein
MGYKPSWFNVLTGGAPEGGRWVNADWHVASTRSVTQKSKAIVSDRVWIKEGKCSELRVSASWVISIYRYILNSKHTFTCNDT